jgi:hypothetical protein
VLSDSRSVATSPGPRRECSSFVKACLNGVPACSGFSRGLGAAAPGQRSGSPWPLGRLGVRERAAVGLGSGAVGALGPWSRRDQTAGDRVRPRVVRRCRMGLWVRLLALRGSHLNLVRVKRYVPSLLEILAHLGDQQDDYRRGADHHDCSRPKEERPIVVSEQDPRGDA